MKKKVLLCGLLVFAGAAPAQELIGECLTGFPVEPGPAPVGCPATLHDVLALNEMQVKRLEEVDFAREDDMFPLLQALMEKQWELRRHLRGSDPNEAMVTMLFEDLKQIFEEMAKVNAKHRATAMALLSASQKLALRRLEEAHKLQFAAWEAIRFNLIETEGDFPIGLSPFGLFGFGGPFSFAVPGISLSGAGQTTLHSPSQDRQRSQGSAPGIPGMQPPWWGLPQIAGR